LNGSRELWDSHARHDPLWAILSDPAKKDGQWNLDRFFQTGVAEISHILYHMRLRGMSVVKRRALDFGCGVGRLSQALAQHFARVDGVDISPAMVALAESLNRHGARVSYHANDRPDLSIFPDHTFDLIVSTIVLQHIEPPMAARYLTELCRVLAPGGAFVFQLPARRRTAGDPPLPDEQNRRISSVPDEAYRASLVVTGAPAAAVRPGAEIVLGVELANASGFEWSRRAFGVIRVGNHWFDDSGYTMLVGDDGRSDIPEPLFPGDRCQLRLTATAPRETGDYWCEIDLAHEGVVWFRERGSQAIRFHVRVRIEADAGGKDASGARGTPPGETISADVWDPAADAGGPREQLPELDASVQAAPREFPMFGIPRGEVEALLAAASVDVVAVDDDRSCGEDWISYRYFARKSK
jgi:SAM-dependent methyltransferase